MCLALFHFVMSVLGLFSIVITSIWEQKVGLYASCVFVCLVYLSSLITKPTKWPVWPAKTQISLGIFFAVRMKKHCVLSYPLKAQRRLWSDWADAQADLSLRWAHSHFVGFVMRRLICMRYFLSFLFLLVSWAGCALWLWHSLDVLFYLFISFVLKTFFSTKAWYLDRFIVTVS